MAIGSSTLNASSNTANDPATSASLDPAGAPVLAFVGVSSATTSAASITFTTSSGTWTKLAGEVRNDATVARALLVYQCIGWSGSSTVQMDANVAATAYVWTFFTISGSSATPFTTIASVGQPETDWDTADTVTATLGSTPASDARQFSCGMLATTSDLMVQDAQFTEIETHAVATPSTALHTSWSNSTSEQASSYTQSGGNNATGGVIIVNVDAAAAATATKVNVIVAGV